MSDRAASMPMSGPDSGFTILEVLVAFNALTIFLAVVLAAFSSALDRDRTSAFYTTATMEALSLVNGFGSVGSRAARSGTTAEGLQWEARAVPLSQTTLRPGQAAAAVWVDVTVRKPGTRRSRTVHLRTVEIVVEGGRP